MSKDCHCAPSSPSSPRRRYLLPKPDDEVAIISFISVLHLDWFKTKVRYAISGLSESPRIEV